MAPLHTLIHRLSMPVIRLFATSSSTATVACPPLPLPTPPLPAFEFSGQAISWFVGPGETHPRGWTGNLEQIRAEAETEARREASALATAIPGAWPTSPNDETTGASSAFPHTPADIPRRRRRSPEVMAAHASSVPSTSTATIGLSSTPRSSPDRRRKVPIDAFSSRAPTPVDAVTSAPSSTTPATNDFTRIIPTSTTSVTPPEMPDLDYKRQSQVKPAGLPRKDCECVCKCHDTPGGGHHHHHHHGPAAANTTSKPKKPTVHTSDLQLEAGSSRSRSTSAPTVPHSPATPPTPALSLTSEVEISRQSSFEDVVLTPSALPSARLPQSKQVTTRTPTSTKVKDTKRHPAQASLNSASTRTSTEVASSTAANDKPSRVHTSNPNPATSGADCPTSPSTTDPSAGSSGTTYVYLASGRRVLADSPAGLAALAAHVNVSPPRPHNLAMKTSNSEASRTSNAKTSLPSTSTAPSNTKAVSVNYARPGPSVIKDSGREARVSSRAKTSLSSASTAHPSNVKTIGSSKAVSSKTTTEEVTGPKAAITKASSSERSRPRAVLTKLPPTASSRASRSRTSSNASPHSASVSRSSSNPPSVRRVDVMGIPHNADARPSSPKKPHGVSASHPTPTPDAFHAIIMASDALFGASTGTTKPSPVEKKSSSSVFRMLNRSLESLIRTKPDKGKKPMTEAQVEELESERAARRNADNESVADSFLLLPTKPTASDKGKARVTRARVEEHMIEASVEAVTAEEEVLAPRSNPLEVKGQCEARGLDGILQSLDLPKPKMSHQALEAVTSEEDADDDIFYDALAM